MWRERTEESCQVLFQPPASAGSAPTSVLTIQHSPCSRPSTHIFRAVISAGDVRLMIVGYGFADEHINAVIAEAVEHNGLSLFIWNTTSDVKSLVLSSPHGARIWKGLISTATRPLIDVFPSNQAETEEYRRICSTFFS